MTEIRWHARAGQGAKTASHILALALLRSGRFVQAFPEYGPERRGAPMRAYTRVSDVPIRRHDPVTRPDVVAVIEPSLLREVDVLAGLAEHGVVLVAGAVVPPRLGNADVRRVPAGGNVNVTMAGAVAALVGAPVDEVVQAATELLGRKVDAEALKAAVEEGARV